MDSEENGKPPEEQDESRDEKGRFKPGFSGNPGGRRKGPTVTGTLRKLLEEDAPTDAGRLSYREAVARRLLMLAIKGDMRAISYLIDRMDGKAMDTLRQALDDEEQERDEAYL